MKLAFLYPQQRRLFVQHGENDLPAHLLQTLTLHDDLIGATTPLHYDVYRPSLTPRFCLHSTQTAIFITSVKITCRNSHTY